MITVLFWVIVLGLLAWGVSAIPIPPPFKTVAYVVLILILVIVLFQAFAGYSPIPLRR